MCKKTKTAGVNSDILPIYRIGGELTHADDVLIGVRGASTHDK